MSNDIKIYNEVVLLKDMFDVKGLMQEIKAKENYVTKILADEVSMIDEGILWVPENQTFRDLNWSLILFGKYNMMDEIISIPMFLRDLWNSKEGEEELVIGKVPTRDKALELETSDKVPASRLRNPNAEEKNMFKREMI